MTSLSVMRQVILLVTGLGVLCVAQIHQKFNHFRPLSSYPVWRDDVVQFGLSDHAAPKWRNDPNSRTDMEAEPSSPVVRSVPSPQNDWEPRPWRPDPRTRKQTGQESGFMPAAPGWNAFDNYWNEPKTEGALRKQKKQGPKVPKHEPTVQDPEDYDAKPEEEDLFFGQPYSQGKSVMNQNDEEDEENFGFFPEAAERFRLNAEIEDLFPAGPPGPVREHQKAKNYGSALQTFPAKHAPAVQHDPAKRKPFLELAEPIESPVVAAESPIFAPETSKQRKKSQKVKKTNSDERFRNPESEDDFVQPAQFDSRAPGKVSPVKQSGSNLEETSSTRPDEVSFQTERSALRSGPANLKPNFRVERPNFKPERPTFKAEPVSSQLGEHAPIRSTISMSSGGEHDRSPSEQQQKPEDLGFPEAEEPVYHPVETSAPLRRPSPSRPRERPSLKAEPVNSQAEEQVPIHSAVEHDQFPNEQQQNSEDKHVPEADEPVYRPAETSVPPRRPNPSRLRERPSFKAEPVRPQAVELIPVKPVPPSDELDHIPSEQPQNPEDFGVPEADELTYRPVETSTSFRSPNPSRSAAEQRRTKVKRPLSENKEDKPGTEEAVKEHRDPTSSDSVLQAPLVPRKINKNRLRNQQPRIKVNEAPLLEVPEEQTSQNDERKSKIISTNDPLPDLVPAKLEVSEPSVETVQNPSQAIFDPLPVNQAAPPRRPGKRRRPRPPSAEGGIKHLKDQQIHEVAVKQEVHLQQSENERKLPDNLHADSSTSKQEDLAVTAPTWQQQRRNRPTSVAPKFEPTTEPSVLATEEDTLVHKEKKVNFEPLVDEAKQSKTEESQDVKFDSIPTTSSPIRVEEAAEVTPEDEAIQVTFPPFRRRKPQVKTQASPVQDEPLTVPETVEPSSVKSWNTADEEPSLVATRPETSSGKSSRISAYKERLEAMREKAAQIAQSKLDDEKDVEFVDEVQPSTTVATTTTASGPPQRVKFPQRVQQRQSTTKPTPTTAPTTTTTTTTPSPTTAETPKRKFPTRKSVPKLPLLNRRPAENVQQQPVETATEETQQPRQKWRPKKFQATTTLPKVDEDGDSLEDLRPVNFRSRTTTSPKIEEEEVTDLRPVNFKSRTTTTTSAAIEDDKDVSAEQRPANFRNRATTTPVVDDHKELLQESSETRQQFPTTDALNPSGLTTDFRLDPSTTDPLKPVHSVPETKPQDAAVGSAEDDSPRIEFAGTVKSDLETSTQRLEYSEEFFEKHANTETQAPVSPVVPEDDDSGESEPSLPSWFIGQQPLFPMVSDVPLLPIEELLFRPKDNTKRRY